MQKILFLKLAFLISIIASAQPGALDLTFDPGTGANNDVWAIAIQEDGKILISGSITFYNGISCNRIVRLNVDGSLDTNFNIGGTGANGGVYTITIQKDGKILIGGGFTRYNETYRNGIARLNSDGSLDTTFNPGSGAGNGIGTISLQNDGKIIIGGSFLSYNGIPKNMLARLNPDGSLDTTFNTRIQLGDPWVVTSIYTSVIQIDGKIIVGGDFDIEDYNDSISRFYLARFNIDGSLDTTIIYGSSVVGDVYTINIQNDDKIIVGGPDLYFNGENKNMILRLTPYGSLDTTFESDLTNGEIMTTAIQPNGKIIIGGSVLASDGETVWNVARLNTDGSLDTTFKNGINAYTMATAIQNDGKIVVGGKFTSYNGIPRNRIARLEGDCESYTFQDVSACKIYTSPSGKYEWIVSGSYSDTLINKADCDSIITVNLTILPFPDTGITNAGTHLIANDTNSTYQWIDCNKDHALISGATERQFNPESNGSFAVIVNRNECIDTSECNEISGLNVETLTQVLNFQIYPNPHNGNFTVNWNGNLEKARITIYNMLGQNVYETTNTLNEHTITLDAPAGMYFVHLDTNSENFVIKMIKE